MIKERVSQELFFYCETKQNKTINFELKNNLNIFVKRAYELNGTIKDATLIEWQFMWKNISKQQNSYKYIISISSKILINER